MTKTKEIEIIEKDYLKELEKGNIPWQRPWSTAGRYAMSHSTKKPYSLLNQMLLRPGEYLTFEECKREGGKVKKGEKGNFVVSWAKIKKVETDEEGNERTTIIPRLKYYYVFEVSQCEGIERNCTEEPKTYGNTPVESADNIITAYINRETVTFTATDSNRAYYSPSEDAVVVPDLKYFEAVEEYYSTSFHELTHSTMHPDRCNRAEERKGKKVAFGSEEYSKEELVAEIGAATLVNMIGLESDKSFKNSVSYIQSWIGKLKNDKNLIVSASSRAEKAVNYILGI